MGSVTTIEDIQEPESQQRQQVLRGVNGREIDKADLEGTHCSQDIEGRVSDVQAVAIASDEHHDKNVQWDEVDDEDVASP
mgnify:FL=1